MSVEKNAPDLDSTSYMFLFLARQKAGIDRYLLSSSSSIELWLLGSSLVSELAQLNCFEP